MTTLLQEAEVNSGMGQMGTEYTSVRMGVFWEEEH